MEQKNLLTQALEFIQAQQRHRWWLRMMTGMAAVVVFVTTYLLILPAITMENSTFEVTATPSEAVLGEVIDSEIYAVADDGREETFFVLSADGNNAGLDESRLDFDSDGIASIEDENGQAIDLHREYTEAGEARYWFVLQEGQSASFSLPWVNGADRYRSEVIEEEIPVEPEETPVEEEFPEEPELPETTLPAEEVPSEEIPPTDTDTGETLPPETETVPEEPSEQPEEPESSETEPGDSDGVAPLPEETPSDTEIPSAGVPQEPEIPAVEDNKPALPEEAAPVEDKEQALPEETSPVETGEPAEDMTGQTETSDSDSLATPSNATFASASISHVRYGGITSMQTVGASAISLSRHGVPMVARAAVVATPSDVDETGEDEGPTETPDPEPADNSENEIEYETVRYTETVLDREGDPEQEGSLTLTFGCGRSLEDAAAGGQSISLSWLDEAPVDVPETPLTVTKEGSFDEQMGQLFYTVAISAEQDCGGTIDVTDRFEAGGTPAHYEADSFHLVLLGADGLETEVPSYLPMIEAREGNFQSFVLSGLPALAAGESYRLTYTAVPEPADGPGGAFQVSNTASAAVAEPTGAVFLMEERDAPVPAEDSCIVVYENLLNISGSGIMSYIEIPAIGVSLPIYHGVEDTVLQIAIGHIEGSSLPIGGPSTHCVVSGHRGLPSAKLFTDLDKLAVGDVFLIRVLDEVLTYEVDQIHIVEPDDMSLLEIEEGQDLCTLVTCTPYGVNSHRLLVRGHRIENQESASSIRITADAMQIEPILVAPAVAAPMLLILLIGLLVGGVKYDSRKKVKRSKKK